MHSRPRIAVLAGALGVVLLAGCAGSSDRDPRNSRSAGAARTSSAPARAAATPTPSRSSVHVPPGRIDTSKVVDLARSTRDAGAHYEFGNADDTADDYDPGGAETISYFSRSRDEFMLTVVPAGSPGFDSNRVSREHPLRIAGTTGYFMTRFRLFPLNGHRPDPHHADDLVDPGPTIAFSTSRGDWAFAALQRNPAHHGASTSAADIASHYATLKVEFTPFDLRLPFRARTLPTGTSITNVRFDTGGRSSDATGVSGFGMTLLHDGVHVQATIPPSQLTHPCRDDGATGPCKDGYGVALGDNRILGFEPEQGDSYTTAAGITFARQLVAAIAPARRFADASTYFPLAQALGPGR